MRVTAARRLVAEGVGTALLVAAVVGSGIMAEQLARGDGAMALLANTLATGAALVAILLMFGPISGAHLNPAVTVSKALARELAPRMAAGYVLVQILGGIAGCMLANAMFDRTAISWSLHVRAGAPQLLSEAVATFGLVGVVIAVGRSRPALAPFAIAAYIVAAYWFTASTSFANPAVTIARAFSDTFAGIRPIDAPAFILAQAVGAALGSALFTWLASGSPRSGARRGAGRRRAAGWRARRRAWRRGRWRAAGA